MADITDFIPLEFALPAWPDDILPTLSVTSSIGLANVELSDISGTYFSATGQVLILEEIVFSIGPIPGLSIALLHAADLTTFGFAFTYLDGDFRLSLTDLSAALIIETNLLKRVENQGGEWVQLTDSVTGEPEPVEISLGGAALSVDQAGQFSFTFESGAPELEITPFMIGDTGVVVEVSGLQLIMSDDAADSLPDTVDSSWRGVYIENATVHLPEGLSDVLPDDVLLDNLFIGSGGFCGRITGNWESEDGTSTTDEKTLCGMPFSIKSASIEIMQNTIAEFSIRGSLTLPFFNGPCDVEIGLSNNGDFLVSLDSEDGLVSITTDLFDLTLNSLGLGRSDDAFYVELGGSLALASLAGVDLPDFSVDGIRITSEGKIAMEGGDIAMEQQEVIDLHGFQIELDAVGFGTEGAENYVSISGAVKLVEGLPAGVSAKGLRVYWTPGGTIADMRVSIEGVGVSFEIPNTLTFDGEVALVGQQFEGAIKLRIIPADLTIDAQLIIGEETDGTETFKYFYIQLDAQLPCGIPLGSTGTALYGFMGLFANNMAPDADSSATDFNWYEDWYKQGTPGINKDKFASEKDALAFGVGTTLGTLADNGYTFTTKVAFVITFPGPVIMLQGIGNILRERSKLTDTSHIFDSLIVFDGNNKTLLAVMSMSYQLPETPAGMILDASATSEAFFDFSDPSNWHVYMGEEEEDKRIRASVFQLFKADAYLMLDSRRLKAGTSIGFDEHYGFEVVEVVLKALMWGEGEVTWAPQHLAGTLAFEGELALRAFEFEFGITAEAQVDGATPHDFHLDADLEVTLNLPWPFEDIEVELHLEWKEAHAAEPISPVLSASHVRAYKTTDSWELVLRDSAHGSGHDDGWFVDTDDNALAVPLDSRPVLLFNRNVRDDTKIGTPSPNVSSEEAGNDSFAYALSTLALHKWNGSDWDELSDLYGSWQATGDEAGTEIELYGDGPFSFTRETSTGASTSSSSSSAGGSTNTPWIDSYLALAEGYPFDLTMHQVDFTAYDAGQNAGSVFMHGDITWKGWIDGTYPAVARDVIIMLGAQDSIWLGPDFTVAGDSKSSLALEAIFPESANLGELAVYSSRPDRVAHVTAMGLKPDGSIVTQTFELLNGQHRYGFDPALFVGVERLALSSDGAYFEGLSWIETSTLQEAGTLIEQATAMATMARAVLEPDTDYRITVATSTESDTSGATSSTQYAFFRTSGPPDEESEFAPYVDAAVLANDGNPHYGAYDVQISFNENYLNDMYASDLSLKVYDENGEDTGAVYTTAWGHLASALEGPYYLSAWISAVAAASGTGSVTPLLSGEAVPDSLYAWLPSGSSLPAGKTLEARIEYQGASLWSTRLFTSAYADFSSMVADFRTQAWRETLPESADFSFGTGDDFDQVYYDKLGLTTKTAPTRPELTALADTAGSIRALLLRFPEPVDWERATLSMTDATDGAVAYDAILNSDGSQAVLTVSGGGTWTEGDYTASYAYALSKSGLPTLYRNGSSSTENASVAIAL
ncbi:MAG TPA: hypothetical protein VM571_09630 [Noviherbaspirillum sp.]|nr:hypothetical protein [Noviherbaspirillum sp.]